MEFKEYFHNHANSIIGERKEFAQRYEEIKDTILSITDERLIYEHAIVKEKRKGAKSLSQAINNIIKETLVNQWGWKKESGIFKEPPYDNTNNKKWRLDFAKDPISLEVAFNHGEAITHNLLKPVLASQLNHVKKSIQTQMGVIITATEELKDKGNFDSAVGTYDKHIEYLKPYSMIITIPMIIIGLDAPASFSIDKISREVKKNS